MTLSVRFKIATEPDEFEQIARLNYRTFAQEIPQHPPEASGKLVDKFHDENTYVIGAAGGRVVAMLAIRGNRPFSLDGKLPQLDSYLPPASSACELRLLAIEPSHRRGRVFFGLIAAAAERFAAAGHDLAVISGTLRQLRLYRHVGFVPFGPVVGTDAAPYQPMYLEVATVRRRLPALAERLAPGPALNFLPGPVQVSEAVRRAHERRAVSHRARAFARDLDRARQKLGELTGASHVHVLPGPGTLANDLVAAQLSLRARHGLVVAQGEFGERLIDHASRFDVVGGILRVPWGEPIDLCALASDLSRRPGIGWIWATHCETSSGVLNDLAGLRDLCRTRGIDLCLDCISSIGTVPLDLRGVALATGSSGKGLAACAGLSFVFSSDALHSSPRVPRVLDPTVGGGGAGVAFTVPSAPLAALLAALDEQGEQRFRTIAALGAMLRGGLAQLGLQPAAGDARSASPAVCTIALPPARRSIRFGRALEGAGILAAYRSRHLRERNAVQFCLMGQAGETEVRRLLAAVRDVLARDGAAPRASRARLTPAGA